MKFDTVIRWICVIFFTVSAIGARNAYEMAFALTLAVVAWAVLR